MKHKGPDAGWAPVVALLEGGLADTYPAAALYCGRGGSATLSLAVGAAEPASHFDLASLTKALCTSVLCMRMCAASRLRLDEPVLPGVSVAALLAHCSGLPAWRPLFLAADSNRDLTTAPSEATRRAVVAAAAETERGPVGQRAVYSDLGFILLGDFLERRAGLRLDSQFAQLAESLELAIAFRPLDAAIQRVPDERCLPTRRESDARPLLQGVVHDDNARAMLGVAGHAGLFGTAAGVARLADALLDSFLDLDTPGRRALAVPTGLVRRFFALPTAPAGATFGLGWDHPDPLLAGGSPSSAGSLWPRDGVGHLGFTGCSLWLDPATRTMVVFLTNRVCVQTAAEAAATHARIKALRPVVHDAVLRAYTGGERATAGT